MPSRLGRAVIAVAFVVPLFPTTIMRPAVLQIIKYKEKTVFLPGDAPAPLKLEPPDIHPFPTPASFQMAFIIFWPFRVPSAYLRSCLFLRARLLARIILHRDVVLGLPLVAV